MVLTCSRDARITSLLNIEKQAWSSGKFKSICSREMALIYLRDNCREDKRALFDMIWLRVHLAKSRAEKVELEMNLLEMDFEVQNWANPSCRVHGGRMFIDHTSVATSLENLGAIGAG